MTPNRDRNVAATQNGTHNGGRVVGRPFAKGENGGHHGQPGRSGRRPSSVTLAAQDAITTHDLIGVLASIANGKDADKDSDRIAAIKLLLAYGYGQPTQVVTHQGDPDQPLEVTVEHRQALASRLDRLAARFAAAPPARGSGEN